jgi:rfaE bifunctional protein nucleotidyltransferase chain/domain
LGQVVSQTELLLHRGGWKRNGRVVVCVAGSFDLLHPGHIRLLEQARSLGDILVVALRSDASVRSAPRSAPIIPASGRSEILAALSAVDEVTEISEPSPLEFLARFRPDVYVRGATPSAERPASREDAEIAALGCRIVRIPAEPGYSTAHLLQRIADLPA